MVTQWSLIVYILPFTRKVGSKYTYISSSVKSCEAK